MPTETDFMDKYFWVDLGHNLSAWGYDDGTVYITYVPTGYIVSAVYTLDDAKQFAADLGELWAQVSPTVSFVFPPLELETALAETQTWEHEHGLHDYCDCEEF